MENSKTEKTGERIIEAKAEILAPHGKRLSPEREILYDQVLKQGAQAEEWLKNVAPRLRAELKKRKADERAAREAVRAAERVQRDAQRGAARADREPKNSLALARREAIITPTKIAEQMIKKLKRPAVGYYIAWDSEIKGFGARITSAGGISFILDYRTVHGRHRRYTIGRFPEWSATAARAKAGELKAKIKNEDDPSDPIEARKQLRGQPTMRDLVQTYKDSGACQQLGKHTRKDYVRMLDKLIEPKLGRHPLKSIDKHDIEGLQASLTATPYQANRVLALVSKMFNFAIENGWIEKNPTKGVKKFHEDKRETWLTVDQITKFRSALDAYKDQSAANCLRLLLLTGSRAGEALKAEWNEFDLTRGVWTKPTHHTKQKKTEHVPLSAPAIELLRGIRPRNAAGPLFPGTKRKGKDGKMTGGDERRSLKRPWLQACKAAGLATVEELKGKRRHKVLKYRPTVRLHDLRHTYASTLASNGVGLQVIGKLLGHVQASTTARYAHAQDEALRAATNKLAEVIEFKKGA